MAAERLDTFGSKLMYDIGYKMSDIVLERKCDARRQDYRLKINQTLPFFFVEEFEYTYLINIGTESNNSRDFHITKHNDTLEIDVYSSLLPIIKKQFDQTLRYLEDQVVYADAKTSIVVRESIMEDPYTLVDMLEPNANNALDNMYAERIHNSCFTGDAKHDHVEADDIVCALLEELGFHKVVETYEDVDKWYA